MALSLKNKTFIDYLGTTVIVSLSFFYIIFKVNFAELCVQFSFFDFPVFVGEWVLLFCLFLFIIKYHDGLHKVQLIHIAIAGYFVFVFLKALMGYMDYGPLALRNAALFYYPIFAVFGFSFYRLRYFMGKKNILIVTVIIFAFLTGNYSPWYVLPLLFIPFILLKAYSPSILRYLLGGLLLLSAPYLTIFDNSRMMIVSHSFFLIYIICVALMLLRMRKRFKAIAFFLVLALFLFALVNLSRRKVLMSFLDLRRLSSEFAFFDNTVQERVHEYEPENFPEIKIYNPNNGRKMNSSYIIEMEGCADYKAPEAANEPAETTFIQDKEILPVSLQPASTEGSLARESTGNILFRLMIWRDLLREFWQVKPVLGFSFGKPFRSPSIEILVWAEDEWRRDGWIAPHNSFLHMLYRGGIVTPVFFGFIFLLLWRMLRDFFRFHSWPGAVMCGIIMIYLVAANFLLILEMPYSAIPFWSFFGMTWGYYKNLLKLRRNENFAAS